MSAIAVDNRPERLDKRLMIALVGLYIGQCIPIYVLAVAVPAIFRAVGVSLSSIGFIGLLMLPWILKFLWAPWIDRYALLPIGHRRSWILAVQLGIIALLLILTQLDPKEVGTLPVLLMGTGIALLVGTQEVAIDGYAVTRLTPRQRAIGNALQGAGTAAGVVLGGTFVLLFYDAWGWQNAILGAAGLCALSMVFLLVMREDRQAAPAWTEADSGANGRPSLRAFFMRPEAMQALAFALIYRLSEGFVKAMENPFLLDHGLSLKDIGILDGASAAFVGLAGAALAALIIRGIGLWPFVYGLGLARTLCFICFAWYAWAEPDLPWFLIGITLFNTVIRYMEIVGLYSVFMGAATRAQAGTDFTLLSSAQLVVFMLGSMASGFIADWIGYDGLFALAVILSGIGIVLSMRVLPRHNQAWSAR
jgi:RhtX/FptX family siderophore transporter